MNAQLKTDPASLIAAGRRALEIEGREFGLALRRVPALGPDVAIAVVRSET